MELNDANMMKNLNELGVDERGSFARPTRLQVSEQQMPQQRAPQPPTRTRRQVSQRQMLQQKSSKPPTPSERTDSQSHGSNNESDIDKYYSEGENEGPYDGGEYDDGDDFIETDSCAMAHFHDSSFNRYDTTSGSHGDSTTSGSRGDSMSIQTITSGGSNRGLNGKKKRPLQSSSSDANTSKKNKVLKGTNITINTVYKSKYACDVCDFSSSSAKELSTHYVSEYHLQLIENNIEKIKFKCDFCKLRTKSRHDFVRHVVESKKHDRRVKKSPDL